MAWCHEQSLMLNWMCSLLSSPTSLFSASLCYLPLFSVGGGGVWPLPGGKCDHKSGFLSQRCPGAATSAAPQRQHRGVGHSWEKGWGTQQNQKYKHTSHPSSNYLQLPADNYFCAHPFHAHRAVSFCLNIHHDLKQHPQLSPLTVFCDFSTFKYLLAKSIAVLKCDLSLLSCAQLPLLGPFLLFTGQGASRRHLPCLTA